MIIRALDADGDFTFGSGIQNYLTNQDAIALDIKTRLQSFQNDCFFDSTFGIDWFNLLGSKNQASLIFAVRGMILATDGVNTLTDISTSLDSNRNLSLSYQVTTIFGQPIGGSITFPVTPFSGISKFVHDLIFNGQTIIDVDVSSHISNAQDAVWTLYDVLNGFEPVVGAVQPINETTVRVTIVPLTLGTFRLVGIA